MIKVGDIIGCNCGLCSEDEQHEVISIGKREYYVTGSIFSIRKENAVLMTAAKIAGRA